VRKTEFIKKFLGNIGKTLKNSIKRGFSKKIQRNMKITRPSDPKFAQKRDEWGGRGAEADQKGIRSGGFSRQNPGKFPLLQGHFVNPVLSNRLFLLFS